MTKFQAWSGYEKRGGSFLLISQDCSDLTGHIVSELLGKDEKVRFTLCPLGKSFPAFDIKIQSDDPKGRDFAEVVGAQEVGDLAQFRVVKNDEYGFILVILYRKNLQDCFGIGTVKLLQVMDTTRVLQPFRQGVGGSLCPQGTGGENGVRADAPKGQVTADSRQVLEAPAREVPFKVAGSLFVPTGFGIADQIELFDG